MKTIIALFLAFASAAVSAASVGFLPDPATAAPGGTFTVDVVGSAFPELAGGTLDLGFDPALVSLDSVAVNAALFDFLPTSGALTAPGEWTGVGFDTFVNAPAAGDFTIATLTLTALAEGSGILSVLGTSQFFSSVAEVFPALSRGSVGVTAVPVPAAVWLFGSGLLGIVGVGRRSR